ncbi:MAG: LptF/LptG family permease [Deltaproteobacteria bacterium]|nr:LptF/LptG family permease [Deltaproteobacteria bacterium]
MATRTLTRHLMKRFGLAALAVVVGLSLVAWVLQVVRTAPEVLTDATPWPAALRVLLLPLVPIAAFVLPVAFAGGLLLAGRSLRAEGAFEALVGCGIAPRRIAQPLLGLALVATAASAGLSLVGEPLALGALRDDVPTLAASMLAGRVVPGSFASAGPGTDVYAERRSGDVLGNVLLVRRGPEGSLELAARELHLGRDAGGNVLRLRDGSLRREAADGVVTATFAELVQPLGADALRERIWAMLPAGLAAGPAAPFDPAVLGSMAPRDRYLLVRRWAPPLQCLLFGLLAAGLVLGRRPAGWNAVVLLAVVAVSHAALRLLEPAAAVGIVVPATAVLLAHLPAALAVAGVGARLYLTRAV